MSSASTKRRAKEDHYGYLHGYSDVEQERLIHQARFFESSVFAGIDWPASAKRILEPGSGVGAQTEILLRRFPDIHVTSVDRQPKQLARAKRYLAPQIKQGRVKLVEARGEQMPFGESSFDGAFICWVLEHVPQPVDLLKDVLRVLRPGAVLHCTEVLNSSFFLHPYAPATLQYWFAFNDHQWNMGGDPFCGAKLSNHLTAAGFQNIETRVRNLLLDKRMPKAREEHLKAFYELLLSGAGELKKAKRVDDKLLTELEAEWTAAMKDPDAVLFYSFVQARAVAL